MTGASVLAHQGGWDEILFVLAPLVLFAALLVVARRRVDRMDRMADRTDEPSAASSTEAGDTDAR